jgi:hypothetical protein
MTDNSVFRPANKGDSRFIAEMIDVSSDGVALIEWTASSQKVAGRTALDNGAKVYASEQGDYSHRNCWIAALCRQRAGRLPGLPMHARNPEEIVDCPRLFPRKHTIHAKP